MSSPTLTCLCGAINHPFEPPSGLSFPMNRTACHCNPCRQATGALYGVFPVIVTAPPESVLSLCTRYDALGPGKGLQRYFCKQCGMHMCFFDPRDSQWHASSGAIEAPDSKVDRIRISGHIFLKDTLDGGILGARPNLVKDGDKTVPCYAEWSSGTSLSANDLVNVADDSSASAKDDAIPVQCHCGGTSLSIKRADWSNASQKDGIEDRHIPSDPHKYHAYLCACRSCRLAIGIASLAAWTTVPGRNITVASTGAVVALGHDAENTSTSLGQYRTSDNVTWHFCKTCGATMLYANKTRPNIADVAVGVLRAPEGTMARNNLQWDWSEVSFAEEAVDRELVKRILASE